MYTLSPPTLGTVPGTRQSAGKEQMTRKLPSLPAPSPWGARRCQGHRPRALPMRVRHVYRSLIPWEMRSRSPRRSQTWPFLLLALAASLRWPPRPCYVHVRTDRLRDASCSRQVAPSSSRNVPLYLWDSLRRATLTELQENRSGQCFRNVHLFLSFHSRYFCILTF